MTDPRSAYVPDDPDHLTAEQVQQLQDLLDQLCLTSYTAQQFVQIDTLTRKICDQTGYGELLVAVKKRHVSTFEVRMRAVADPGQQHSPME